MKHHFPILIAACSAIAGCGGQGPIGEAPDFTPVQGSTEQYAMLSPGLPITADRRQHVDRSSLWTAGQQSLLGDRRAAKRGDIVTVVVEIDDEAEIKNSSSRSRSGQESMNLPHLFGIPQRVNRNMPEGASMDEAVSLGSTSDSSGDGSVRRNEKLTLRIAATVMDTLPNGVLVIEGRQEVRVNFELRELLVTGFARPEDISRMNEITYDKIASARISYGGRGQISEVQQPRYGQQILGRILPF